jgi:hypothetical protein
MATVGYTPAPYEQVSEDMRDFVIFGGFDCAVSFVESRARNDDTCWCCTVKKS